MTWDLGIATIKASNASTASRRWLNLGMLGHLEELFKKVASNAFYKN